MDAVFTIRKQYVKKHIYMMVVEQLLDDYRQQGFEIKTQYPISATLRADIFAVRDNERVVIELVDGAVSASTKQRLEGIAAGEGVEIKLIDISRVKFEK